MNRSDIDYHAYVRALSSTRTSTRRRGCATTWADFTRAVIDLDAGRGGNFARAAHSIRKKYLALPPVEVNSDDR